LFNAMTETAKGFEEGPADFIGRRRAALLDTVRSLGLLGGESARIGARVKRRLLDAARKQSGLTSDTELLEYALARVALEDNFIEVFNSLKGAVPRDIDLEF
jgi:hypothetical protein